jgi:diacylglycerol kinase family enzyme
LTTVVVVNPSAAAGRVGKQRTRLRHAIETVIGPCRFVETVRQGHAPQLVHEAIESGATRLLSLGGDGTHHEVVNGIMAHPDGEGVTLGILPVGTGGDLKRTLGAHSLPDALRAVVEEPVRAVDVGHARFFDDHGHPTERWFINIASCGISGLVDRLVNSTSKRLGDGRSLGQHEAMMVLVGNGCFAGGGMQFCPHAQLDDGLLDLLIVPAAPLLPSLLRTRHLYQGTLAAVDGVISARATQVTVRPLAEAAQLLLDLDGESPGTAPVTFSNHPKKLKLAGWKRPTPECVATGFPSRPRLP